MRAVAASLVVVDHTLGTMTALGTLPKVYEKAGFLAGDAGVAAFFALSGLILVRVSYGDFEVPHAGIRFLCRRLLRIAPMYWLTTLLCLALFANATRAGYPPQTRLGLKLLFSFLFIPNVLATDMRLMPLVGQGWTLNYEMAFYCLLALCLGARKRLGVLITVLVPIGLVTLGFWIPNDRGGLNRLAGFYTDSFLLLFSGGAMIGWWEMEMRHLPVLRTPLSPAFLLLLPVCLVVAFANVTGAVNLFPFFRFLGFVTVLLCAISGGRGDGWWSRLSARLGDASYSTYLVHIFAIFPICFVAKLLNLHGWWNMPLLALSVAAAHALGSAVYTGIERPLTERLRRALSRIAGRVEVKVAGPERVAVAVRPDRP
jgi:exopolysaccharide production protein ExoZ